MRLGIIAPIDRDVPKPVVMVDQELDDIEDSKEYYGILIKEPYTKPRIHIYPTAYEALEKYEIYLKKFKNTIDPIEYDDLKHTRVEVDILRPVIDRKSYQVYKDRFTIDTVIKRNFW